MKKLSVTIFALITILSLIFINSAEAKTVRVKGYYNSRSSSYVAPYYKTSPDKYKFNNYSTKGNYNPYTGKKGYVNPYKW
ncbi:MAG: hypothetical protein UX49_C0021G0020 [Candidatus Wolfebacteria bacterium GW2011_GWC2_46_275]|uniref:Uncharacterized protein n=2 Tax=Candidatus Wolfeibacteriota TaxID=1752735 RepID=A0A0G1WJN1_9BACT|nr:MAG: hypothetical protein UX70_C0001G0799 [Candidatus Wolfebacteria bacterium GW2011_GWB1_47_1]KKU36196.1 MAG: hypothetical protein UX49_C0021G0020 [Candidatus Wolfebacteria bacterium GW2011_GWC2_46_275]KKU42087.1 MAG: hypothetical protein UX58_C0003G0011 [Candidatus Wolfebacteria bacterium GW2011_GWB2_46_69]KKU59324.1 MAG: hypothetical protein UX83_C0006G0094 [Candidatus Wolfebacteria bacterium GW2011_GWE2_47_12]KKU66074.1 MAG: hypothetical protein UX90_C0001G0133 [Candidatus Wolfebacteria 